MRSTMEMKLKLSQYPGHDAGTNHAFCKGNVGGCSSCLCSTGSGGPLMPRSHSPSLLAKLLMESSLGSPHAMFSQNIERDPRMTGAGLLPAAAKRHDNTSPAWHPTCLAFLASVFTRAFGAERHRPLGPKCPKNGRGDPCVTASEGGTPAHPESIPTHKAQRHADCLEQA